ncbi:hypothetical protein [Ochrobactrum sp. A-1]|uniref:hypothetical protein n=1 Tax=Ochrobactrum sp. A-1 TaxID=2920940 RepID=UPI001F0A4BFA|nr:hypothetical protein [Ochrobactrum sp. A-1]
MTRLTLNVPTKDDFLHVARNMRARDAAEFMAVSAAQTREQLADVLAESYASHPGVICGYANGEPTAIGAMVLARPNVVTLMFFATDGFKTIAAPLTRFIRQRLFPRYENSGVHRIECVSIDGYEETHRWIRALGLKHEAKHEGYGRNGETFHTFSKVKIDVR